MIGKSLAHYEILDKIGQGGMGDVYRARDTKLGREVALKVLPADKAADTERRKRFRREATAVASLKHPNIVTIHSVEDDGDTVFLTMELVEGTTLAGHIPTEGMNLVHLLEVGIPVADAVAYAHTKGIMHRDLKPANIMLDEAGRPKVLDFGLAKLLEMETTPEGATLADDISATAAGMVLGTAAYMSPEQAEGKPTDARSDVFSLGIVLYEMATGRKPFHGDTAISTISSILKDTPQPVTEVNRSLPNHLGRVVSRCLAKEPSRRYQMALEIKNELEGLKEETSGIRPATVETPSVVNPPPITVPAPKAATGGIGRGLFIGGVAVVALAAALGIWRPWAGPGEDAPATPVAATQAPASVTEERKMAVVLPFENLGPPDDAYFAAGMTEEITGRLASVSGLGVISRTSATQYDRTGKTMKQIGEDLGVDYVLEGSVRWAKSADGGGRVRISPRLIQVEGDEQVWGETYDREIDDIFQVQSDIAGRVIEELGITLSGSESEWLAQKPTEDQEAYRLYLEALDLKASTFQEQDTGFVERLEKVTALDPGFLEAWSRLSLHHSAVYFQIDRTEGRLAQARRALEGAEAVEADHPLTRVARGAYYYYGHRDYDRALTEFSAAVAAQPNDAKAQRFVSYILRRQGKLQESIDALEKAVEVDPQNVEGLENLASSYRACREFARAGEYVDRALALDPDNDDLRGEKAWFLIASGADPSVAQDIIGAEPGSNPLFFAFNWTLLHRLEGNYAKAKATMSVPEVRNPVIQSMINSYLALLEAEEKGPEAARAKLESSVKDMQRALDNAPTDSQVRGIVAMLHALLGHSDAAVREARIAMEMSALDKFSGPKAQEELAKVLGLVGRETEAIENLDRLLQTDYEQSITVPILRVYPEWAPLRGREDFEALLRRHESRVP